jgi:hypothetical protein
VRTWAQSGWPGPSEPSHILARPRRAAPPLGARRPGTTVCRRLGTGSDGFTAHQGVSDVAERGKLDKRGQCGLGPADQNCTSRSRAIPHPAEADGTGTLEQVSAVSSMRWCRLVPVVPIGSDWCRLVHIDVCWRGGGKTHTTAQPGQQAGEARLQRATVRTLQ